MIYFMNQVAFCLGWALLLTVLCGVLFCSGYVCKVALRRPYYFFKHLLPWKWSAAKENWSKWEQAENFPQYHSNGYDYHFYRQGNFGLMVNKGNHEWWEPVHRLFYLK